VRILRLRPINCLSDVLRLESLNRLSDAAHASSLLRDSGNEPMPLVVAEEELALVLTVPHEQKQVVQCRRSVDDVELDLVSTREAKLEVLAVPIAQHVDRRHAEPRSLLDLYTRADCLEPALENPNVHLGSPF
jgi:hypothetical protein